MVSSQHLQKALSMKAKVKHSRDLKVAILTLYTKDILSYAKYGLQTKSIYAKKNGYDFIIYDEIIDQSRPPAWSKIKIIEQHLVNYDWVFWSDADSLIMNHTVKLESMIDASHDKDMIMTPGPICKYNTGQWLVRNSNWSFDVLQKTWENVRDTDFWFKENPWEQYAFVDLSNKMANFDDHISVVGVRQLNARPAAPYIDGIYSEDIYEQLKNIGYKDGDFIIHFYHTKNFDKRVEGMKYYYQHWLCLEHLSLQSGSSKIFLSA
jgi:hypothetical protein